jgi:integrase
MAYIAQRKDLFYVVDYDGVDPLTGRKRRRWHPIGSDREEAQAIAGRLGTERVGSAPTKGGPTTFGDYLTATWLPQKRRTVRASTAYRYSWFVEHYINPAIGHIPLRRLREDHLDSLYETLAATGGRDGAGLAPKTILEVHMIIRAALDQAVHRQLVVRNVAHPANARRRPPSQGPARIWTAAELNAFLSAARHQRLYPALHLVAHTGLRRGELVGLKWSDLDERQAVYRSAGPGRQSPARPSSSGSRPAPAGPRAPAGSVQGYPWTPGPVRAIVVDELCVAQG